MNRIILTYKRFISKAKISVETLDYVNFTVT